MTFNHFIFNALVGYPTFDISFIEITHILVVSALESVFATLPARTSVNDQIAAAFATVIGKVITPYHFARLVIFYVVSVYADNFTA